MPNVLCLMTSQSSISVDGHSLIPHCGASSSCLRAFMEELSRHNIGISYATTHGQECSVFVEEQDSEWYFSNSAAYGHPLSLSECNVSDFDGLLIPSSYGGLTDLVSSRFEPQCVLVFFLLVAGLHVFRSSFVCMTQVTIYMSTGKLKLSFQNAWEASCLFAQ